MLRDDLDLDKEYSLSANHDDEHGKALRKKIWKVTIILTAITIVEVITGGSIKQFYDGVPNESWWMIKWGFIFLYYWIPRVPRSLRSCYQPNNFN